MIHAGTVAMVTYYVDAKWCSVDHTLLNDGYAENEGWTKDINAFKFCEYYTLANVKTLIKVFYTLFQPWLN